MTYQKPHIEFFINDFTSSWNSSVWTEVLETVYTNGYCFHFAAMLNIMYPGGDIYYDTVRGHFLYFYQNDWYDVTGPVTVETCKSFLVKWSEFEQYDALQYERILRDCVYKIDATPALNQQASA